MVLRGHLFFQRDLVYPVGALVLGLLNRPWVCYGYGLWFGLINGLGSTMVMVYGSV